MPAHTGTHCPYCALQCAITVDTSGAEPVVEPREFPTNRGGLCRKGWTSAALLSSRADRLTQPLMRDGGQLRPVSWETALGRVADELTSLRHVYGPDAVAVFGGGGLTNEKAYALGKFARVALGTSQIDYNGRFCMSSAAAAGTRAFGLDRGLPFPVTDLDDAEVVLLAGANVAETMPPFVGHLRRAVQIVVDPRRTATAEQAIATGGLHLPAAPGTDLVLALAMFHAAVTDGWLDKSYVDSRTTGFDETWRLASTWWPERAERVTGVAAADIRTAVSLLASAERAYVLTARGVEQHAHGTDTAQAWINLALALGLPGRPGSGYGTITGQGNGQGGREHGQKADQLPGGRKLDDPAARAHVAGVWGVDPDSLPRPGRSAYELLDALGEPDGPRALLVFGSNIAVSAPNLNNIREKLSRLSFLAVADVVLSETAAMADVVFPVAQFAEEEGTLTNLEGRVLRRKQAMKPPPGVRTDLQLLASLASHLGQPKHRFPTDPRTVFEELRAASAGGLADYSGITYERLENEALHWPCPATDHPGTPRPFLDRFAHPDGLARFVTVESAAPAENLDAAYPLYATTGRLLEHYQSGAQTRRVGELMEVTNEQRVDIHPDTAERAGLTDGGYADVVSRRGRTRARVRCVSSMRLDTVFLPFHFAAEQSANLVTNAALDPVSRMPEFKVAAVRLEPV
ncbi:molybdopterin oxidoreductase family protein [Fodinicola acaciae]|uniref:molybdopterin oxidoreductase family protein n=1 Tax=Fodinicola acaciae TaxID=2681555 RepID=UPI0013D5F118|nr:molybdopterin oxidoreductase family protein [Fodinicola acaciae]